MSKLQQLIDELCPKGVEFKELGEMGRLYPGLSGKSKQDFNNGDSKYVTYKSIFSCTKVDLNDVEYVSVDENENQNEIEHGDVLFTGSSEIIDECGMSSVVDNVGNEKIYLNSFCFGYRFDNKELFNVDFLKHLFRADLLRKQITKTANGVTRYNISKKKFVKVVIPVPPLEVQNEIVRILDNFTELTAELTAELEARKKQYEYYENKIIFNPNYSYLSLKEVCAVNQGLQIPISKRFVTKSSKRYFYITIQFLKGSAENYYIENPPKSAICKAEDILVTRTGSTGQIVTGVKGCFHNNFFKVTPNDKVHKKFLYYVLKSRKIFLRMLAVSSGGTVPDLPHGKFYKIEIPVPNLDIQLDIIRKMDTLTQLIDKGDVGLPAEIYCRKEQYEYYREELLNFKRL